jgi:hypothetical protein
VGNPLTAQSPGAAHTQVLKPTAVHDAPGAHDPTHPTGPPNHWQEFGTVVVVVVAQPPCVQASQQLAKLPVHARPPFGAVHFVALLLIVHDVRPWALVRQQVTDPGLPQIDLVAQCFTTLAQLLFTSTRLACCAPQLTKAR